GGISLNAKLSGMPLALCQSHETMWTIPPRTNRPTVKANMLRFRDWPREIGRLPQAIQTESPTVAMARRYKTGSAPIFARTIAVHPIITMSKTHTLSVAYRNKIVMYGGYGRLELPVPAKIEPAPWMNAPPITKSVTAYATNVMMPKTTTDPRIAVI